MKQMGNNPNIYLSSDGQIQIVSTIDRGSGNTMQLNPAIN